MRILGLPQVLALATFSSIVLCTCNVKAATIMYADVILRERVYYQNSRQFVVSADFNGIEGAIGAPTFNLVEGWEETFSNWEEVEYGLSGQWGLFSSQGFFDFRFIPFDYSEINLPFPELSTNDRVMLVPPNIVTVTHGTIANIENLTPDAVRWRDLGGGQYALRPEGNSSIHTIHLTAQSGPQDFSSNFSPPSLSVGDATVELRVSLTVYREFVGRVTFAVPEPCGGTSAGAGFFGVIIRSARRPRRPQG